MSAPRLNALRKQMRAQNLDALIVINRNQVRYLTGFYGHEDLDGYLMLSGPQAILFTDFRYTDYARKAVKGAKVVIVSGTKIGALSEYPKLGQPNLRLGYHTGTVTTALLEQIKSTLPRALPVPADEVFAEMGWVKDKGELGSITKAVRIADVAFERILSLVAPGIRERDLAAELEYQMNVLGSEKPAFESAVVSGYRSAMPHGLPTSKKLVKGDFVTFDFGATVDGYVPQWA